jgi:ASC-1-like (ASCH) protein
MIHQMKLRKCYFDMIRDGSKSIEGRINDESRKKVKVGDQILFSCQDNNEKVMCRVL